MPNIVFNFPIDLIASINNSVIATYIIAPAANPKPIDTKCENINDALNAITAINGCGKLVKIHQMHVLIKLTFCGININETANPSGIL